MNAPNHTMTDLEITIMVDALKPLEKAFSMVPHLGYSILIPRILLQCSKNILTDPNIHIQVVCRVKDQLEQDLSDLLDAHAVHFRSGWIWVYNSHRTPQIRYSVLQAGNWMRPLKLTQ